MASRTSAALADAYRGTDRLIVGIVLAVVTFRLFAQTTFTVAPAMRDELGIGESLTKIAWSIGSWGGSGGAALFGGFAASSLGWRSIFWISIVAIAITVPKDDPRAFTSPAKAAS
jgi:MFS transporter, DHA2 family, multidrug resistance protein